MNILITGFAPFGGDGENPSQLALEALPGAIAGARLAKRLLPVSFLAAQRAVCAAIASERPDAVLLTGDAEKEVEAQLPGELASGLLKVGHHGSSTSTSAAFLKKVAPGFAVIMVGQDNSYNHPNAKVVQRLTQAGAQVLRTDESGTITLQSQGQGWQRIED